MLRPEAARKSKLRFYCESETKSSLLLLMFLNVRPQLERASTTAKLFVYIHLANLFNLANLANAVFVYKSLSSFT